MRLLDLRVKNMFNKKVYMKRYKQTYYKLHKSYLIAQAALWNKANPEVRALVNAKYRCENPNSRAFKSYGGRGIRFRLTLDDLIDDIGLRPGPEFSIDRIDNDGDYVIGNIRWATRKQQMNNRRNSRCLS